MKREGEQILLRVHLRNTDRHHWRSAADAVLERAHAEQLAGATLLRGIYGLDITGRILHGSGLSLVEHVPVVLEMVDSPQAIGRFLTPVGEIVSEGLATLERAHVLIYRRRVEVGATRGPVATVPPAIPELSTLPSTEDAPVMKFSEQGQQLRVFIGESDVWHGEPLYQTIVHKARDLGLASATVLRGAVGFGAANRIHSSRLPEVSTGLPLVVEIVDSAEKIQSLLPFLDECVEEGFVTIEAVRILKYPPRRGP